MIQSIRKNPPSIIDAHSHTPLNRYMPFINRQCLTFSFIAFIALFTPGIQADFKAGASMVDISPAQYPVRVNGSFTERSATQAADKLFAKALALDDGRQQIILCVVDSCMVPRTLIDRAKSDASRATGIPMSQMMVSATHTHSAPSAMGCLGSRVDPRYAAMLPDRIARSMVNAVNRLKPARIGWAQMEDWKHTFNRRWIRRPDKVFNDPFGQNNVRAHMHPGHENPDATGPSGPVDPELSVMALQTMDGEPLAVFANYSMHYFGSPLLSADYYGRFAEHIANQMNAGADFVAIMSQGTSGDLMWMDYGVPRENINDDGYAEEMANLTAALVKGIKWHETAPLRIAQNSLSLAYRIPGPGRLAWAEQEVEKMGNRLPRSQPEIYAKESIYLHERQQTELILQALRIGDLGITAIPNEVFAITGLKLKRQSPLTNMFNISLANGAEGYIPPPEQHALGGYTTWAARTAGLEINAEPRIVESLLKLLEEVSDRPRRALKETDGPYAQSIQKSNPMAYWRLEEMSMPVAHDITGRYNAHFEEGVALHLPGADERIGYQAPIPPAKNAFSYHQINRSTHFAGGRLNAKLPLGNDYTIEFWLWNGLPADSRAVTGYVFSRGRDGDPDASGEHLGIGGTQQPHLAGRLFLFNGNKQNQILGGRNTLAFQAWHHVVFVREGDQVRVHLDGRTQPEIDGVFSHTIPEGEDALFLGGRNDNLFNFEGKLDEIAIYDRSLSPDEIEAHYKASALAPPSKITATGPVAYPMTPEASIKKIHIRDGYEIELVAREPLTMDPVAIDWDTQGKLWVIEMADYPLGLDGKGQQGGRVRMLEDLNRDGIYDQQSLFTDSLSFPTGILTWRGGVIVTAAPEILFLRDTNMDGKADSREVLVSGLSTGNQQLRANGLRWGLDGWVYCASGGHHGNYGIGTKLRSRAGETLVGSRDFRFRPDTGELEPVSGPSQNGRNRDNWGRWFGTQNMRPLWHYVLPDHYLRRNPHIAAPNPTQLVVTPLGPEVFPASVPEKRFHSFNEAGHFTSACGGMFYRDNVLWPEAAGKQHAFTCEPFHNLVQHHLVTDEGVSFSAERDAPEGVLDFFASEDRWCRPVMTRTGPDGALWVVDMYRYMIEHPEWLPNAGREELLPHYRIGEDMGRIYRISPVDSAPFPIQDLSQLNTEELVTALDSSNGWLRDKVHMLLVWRGDEDSKKPLRHLLSTTENPMARVHALWLLNHFKALSAKQLISSLNDMHPGVRENALRLAETQHEPSVIASAAKLTDDPDAKVRLQLAFTLGAWQSPVAGTALGKLMTQYHSDPFMKAACFSSGTPHLPALVESVMLASASTRADLNGSLAELALAVNAHSSLAALLEPVFYSASGTYTLDQMQAALQITSMAARRGTDLSAIAGKHEGLAAILSEKGSSLSTAIFDFARESVLSQSADLDLRVAAAKLLARDVRHSSEALRVLASCLNPRQPVNLQKAALEALGTTRDASVSSVVLNAWITLSPSIRQVALEVLLSGEPWSFSLLEAVESGKEVPLDALQQGRLLRHTSKRVRKLAEKALTRNTDRTQIVERYKTTLQLQGDPGKGKSIFNQTCAACHQLGGMGKELGPDLKTVVNHSPEKLLSNILDPSRDIQPGYHAYQCELTDGTELYGLITNETGNSITMKKTDGSVHSILRKDIESLRGGQLSLMPDGLEKGLSHQDIANLIALLRLGGEAIQ